MLQAVVIDDEEQSREELSRLLAISKKVHVSGYGYSVDTGIKAILQTNPDIVFLDIHLGANLGFEILNKIPSVTFSLVVTTAHEDYALQAFRHFAINYLLKPVNPHELFQTIRHIEESNPRHLRAKVESLMHSLNRSSQEKITIPHSKGLTCFAINDILRFEAEGAYTRIILKSAPPFLTSKNLGEIEQEIKKYKNFLRVHRSSIINLTEVVHFTGARYIMMSDGEIINISRQKKKIFVNQIKSYHTVQ